MNDGMYTRWRTPSHSNDGASRVEVALGDWRKSSHSGGNGNCVEVAFAGWRKSSHSNSSANCVEVALDGWRKSSHSGGNGNCVEVADADADGAVGVRDSKQRGRGPVLEFTPAAWRAFVRSAGEGEFDL